MNVLEQKALIASAPQQDDVASGLAARHSRRAKWESLCVSGVVLCVVVAANFGLWESARNSAYTGYQNYLMSLALAAAATVDPQLHNRIRRPEQLNDPDYLRAVEPLRRIRHSVPDIHYIYTLVRSNNEYHFVLDASDPDTRAPNGQLDQSAVWETYRHDGPTLDIALGDETHPGIAIATTEPFVDEWGTFLTGFAPLRDATGHQIGVLGVDVDASRFLARQTASRNRAVLGLAPAAILIALLGIIFYRVRRRGLADAHEAIERAAVASRTAEALTEERRRLSAVIEGTNVGTWEWHADTRWISINERVAGLLGYQRDQLEPVTFARWRALVHRDDYRELRRAIGECLSNFDAVFVHEFRVLRSDGQWLWILARGKVMQADAQGKPAVIAGIVMDVSARKALENALIKSAQLDRLTGLPNRTVFMEHLELTLKRVRERQQTGCAVLFFDFDRFKIINDTLGHEAGDELLRQIGRRLQTALRLGDFCATDVESDLLSRFGGDEFLVLVNNLHSPEEAVRVAERLLNALAPSYSVLGHEVHSMASVGIVTSSQCGGSAEEFVRNADVAMYEAKRAGRGCSVVFSEAMHARLTRHLAIETSLRRAIGTSELYLEYQPVIDLESGELRSVEVSLRWNHPTMGLIAPNEFIPIAEESGLLQAIGQWVLEEAIGNMVKWRGSHGEHAPETISINLSRSGIALGERLVQYVRSTLHSYGLPATCLQFEISEHEVARNPEGAGRLFRALDALGVKLAMDEFGAGHCSLSVLSSYPFDTIKLDRSFLHDLHGNHSSLAVVGATLALIRNLGLQSVAEGVEDSTQLAILQSLGCRCAQGPLFGEPMLAGELCKSRASGAELV